MNPDKKVRRLQMLLYTSGVGTILFSLWSGVREIRMFMEEIQGISSIDNQLMSEEVVRTVSGIVFFFFLFWVVALHLYIGKTAIAVGLGKRKGNAYLVLASVILIFSVSTYIYDLISTQLFESLEMDRIILLAIDLTSDVILAEVVIFSILLKRKRK